MSSHGKSMGLAVGTRFGLYEIVGTLGAGGMREVYRAPHYSAEPLLSRCSLECSPKIRAEGAALKRKHASSAP